MSRHSSHPLLISRERKLLHVSWRRRQLPELLSLQLPVPAAAAAAAVATAPNVTTVVLMKKRISTVDEFKDMRVVQLVLKLIKLSSP